MSERPCPACGEPAGVDLFPLRKTWPGELARTEYGLVLCPSCRSLFLSPEPPAPDLAAIYGHTQFASPEYTDVSRISRAIEYYGSCLQAMSRSRGWEPPISVLEIGAGRAWMCLAAKLVFPGSRTLAQDVTHECAASTPWADRYKVVGLPELDGNERFHVVSLTHVIEHLVAPRDSIRRLGATLRHDGLIFVTAPHRPVNFDPRDAEGWRSWSYNHVPAHLQYFGEAGMEQLANWAGLKLAHWDAGHEEGQAFEAWLSLS